jgi:hypothetical protein
MSSKRRQSLRVERESSSEDQLQEKRLIGAACVDRFMQFPYRADMTFVCDMPFREVCAPADLEQQ